MVNKSRLIPDHNDPIVLKLRRIRMEMNMPQAELARRLGVAPCAITRWEMGRGDCLGHTMLDWAQALGYKFILAKDTQQ